MIQFRNRYCSCMGLTPDVDASLLRFDTALMFLFHSSSPRTSCMAVVCCSRALLSEVTVILPVALH